MQTSKSFKKPAKILISLLVCSKISHSTFANNEKYDESDYKFNKAKKDYVYDPKTKEWIKIKDLQEVQEKESKEEEDGDKVIHKDSWVFDEKTKKWEKVDIKNRIYDELDDDEERTFGQNFSIGFSAGIGYNFLKSTINNFGLTYFGKNLVLVTEHNKIKEFHKTNWMHDRYVMVKPLDKNSENKISVELKNANGESFFGQGLYIPFNFFVDYTAFQLIRFGITLGIEALIIKKIKPSDNLGKKAIKEIDNEGFTLWNLKTLFNFGIIFHQTSHHDFLILTKIGMAFDKGIGKLREDKSRENIFTSPANRRGLNIEAGLAWEYHATGYMATIVQFMYDFKMYNDIEENWKKSNSSIKINSNAIKLELGLRFNFEEIFVN